MIENKRFRKVMGFIQDKYGEYNDDHDNLLDLTEIETALNRLNDENEQLIQEMRDLGTAHAEEINKIEDEFDEEILKLEKENEQLKQFKENVFKVIDKKIEKYEGARYIPDVLRLLKKELQS